MQNLSASLRENLLALPRHINETISNAHAIGGFSGSSGHSFTGTYNGNSNAISSVNVTSSSNHNGIGLFGCVDGGTIKNVIVNGISAPKCATPTGAIVGIANNATIDNCSSGATVTASKDYSDGVGGIVGQANGAGTTGCTITNCTFSGTVDTTKVAGGIVGKTFAYNTIQYCTLSKSGTVNASVRSGGIVGSVYYGNSTYETSNCSQTQLLDCTVSGTVRCSGTKSCSAGGVAGYLARAVQIYRCTISGTIFSTGQYVGGVFGYHLYSANSTKKNSGITTCIITSTASITGDNFVGGIGGRIYGSDNFTADVNYSIRNCSVYKGAVLATTVTNVHGTQGEDDEDADSQMPIFMGGILATLRDSNTSKDKGVDCKILNCSSQPQFQISATIANCGKTDNYPRIGGVIGQFSSKANSLTLGGCYSTLCTKPKTESSDYVPIKIDYAIKKKSSSNCIIESTTCGDAIKCIGAIYGRAVGGGEISWSKVDKTLPSCFSISDYTNLDAYGKKTTDDTSYKSTTADSMKSKTDGGGLRLINFAKKETTYYKWNFDSTVNDGFPYHTVNDSH